MNEGLYDFFNESRASMKEWQAPEACPAYYYYDTIRGECVPISAIMSPQQEEKGFRVLGVQITISHLVLLALAAWLLWMLYQQMQIRKALGEAPKAVAPPEEEAPEERPATNFRRRRRR